MPSRRCLCSIQPASELGSSCRGDLSLGTSGRRWTCWLPSRPPLPLEHRSVSHRMWRVSRVLLLRLREAPVSTVLRPRASPASRPAPRWAWGKWDSPGENSQAGDEELPTRICFCLLLGQVGTPREQSGCYLGILP